MTLQEAIVARHSVRAYRDEPLAPEAVKALEEKIAEVNRRGRLHVQLVQNEPEAFKSPLAKYGKFVGVNHYLIMAGVKANDLDERIGYYGEELVLLAQTLGLNTCWVGLTYRKVPGTFQLADGEVVKAAISIGYGVTQGVSHKIKSVSQVSNADASTPAWFLRGVEAALLAPTAINQQKFHFEYLGVGDGQRARVRARRGIPIVGFTQMDLGIAKLHFELGAGRDNFDWVE